VTPAISFSDLVIGYDGRAVATVPARELSAGRIWLVAGANGSGKTTLLKTLAGLLPPISGSVSPPPEPGAAGSVFVHATPVLFRGTVRSNLAVTADQAGIEAAAGAFGLSEWLDRPVRELSQGIRQRASIARAVALSPRILLVDEAEGGLDDRGRELWATFVHTVIAARRMVIVVAAHKPDAMGVPTERISLGSVTLSS
jgi:ABC-type multidrug transport system ATPase subunit